VKNVLVQPPVKIIDKRIEKKCPSATTGKGQNWHFWELIKVPPTLEQLFSDLDCQKRPCAIPCKNFGPKDWKKVSQCHYWKRLKLALLRAHKSAKGHFYSVFTLEVFFPSHVWYMCQVCTISNQNCNITIPMSKMSHFLSQKLLTLQKKYYISN